MIRQAIKWLCNCFCGGPKPAEDTTLTCTNTGIDGVDSLNGEACTNPTEMETVADLPTDPPQCYGGDTDPCTSAHLYRAVFPCAVPGGCEKVHTMTYQDNPDLPAPSAYAACTNCFEFSIEGMGSGVGDMTTACCYELNGDWDLCFKECESTSSVLVWRTACLSTVASESVVCGPRHGQRDRASWKLTYDIASTTWTLRSYTKVQHPTYTLVDATPCDGTPKILDWVSEDITSGCLSFPTTVTITTGVDCTCTDTLGTGCSVNLWRQCGETTYQYRAGIAQSAIASENLPDDEQNQLPTDAGCCSAKYEYIWSPGDCCPTQVYDFFGRVDPWKTPVNELVWELDPVADPPTLTGYFDQGTVVFSGDTAMVCDGTTHFTRASSTLANINFAQTCCVVADKVMTCNVRELSSPPTTPQQSAGYDEVTGHADFCACNDTCSPSIQGRIIISDSNGAACADQFICYSRQNTITGQDADAKTAFPRIGCIRIWDGEKYNTLTQVVYCAGTTASPNRWASDWYCTTGTIGETTTRQCNSCTAYVGTLLGTTYAIKDECGLLPNFPFPDSSGDCHCAGTVVTSCCPDVFLPEILYASDGTNTVTLTWNGSLYEGAGALGGCTDATVRFECSGESPPFDWSLSVSGFVGGVGTGWQCAGTIPDCTAVDFSCGSNNDGCDGAGYPFSVTA